MLRFVRDVLLVFETVCRPRRPACTHVRSVRSEESTNECLQNFSASVVVYVPFGSVPGFSVTAVPSMLVAFAVEFGNPAYWAHARRERRCVQFQFRGDFFFVESRHAQ